jgi:RNA polymerase sigma-70 factor, ECF subfamily
MGIVDKAVPETQDGTAIDPVSGQEFHSEEIADRTLYLLTGWDAAEEKEKKDGRPHGSDSPREQILALYDEYRPRLFRYIRSMNLNQDQAEEVIQETFMRLTTELLQENDIENVQGWIVRVAHNLAVDALKKKNRRAAKTPEIASVLEDRIDPASSPEDAYLKKEQISRIEIVLSTINPQQRHCFHLRVQGFRYKDIGLALGISEQRAAFIVKKVSVRLAAHFG